MCGIVGWLRATPLSARSSNGALWATRNVPPPALFPAVAQASHGVQLREELYGL